MSSQSKVRASAEVTAVFILTFAAIWVLRISPVGTWERSIIAPALVHGVPLAIAYAFLGR